MPLSRTAPVLRLTHLDPYGTGTWFNNSHRGGFPVKILVTVKRVPDPNATIKVKPDGSGIVTDNLKYVINPFDEIGIEEALRLKEKSGGAEVVLVRIGGKVSSEQLRTGRAR